MDFMSFHNEILEEIKAEERAKESKTKNHCINVLIPLMKRNGITIYDLQAEIEYREKHKNDLFSCKNDDLRVYFTEELINCRKFWKDC